MTAQNPIMEIAHIHDTLEWQARHCDQNSAPITARVLRGMVGLLTGPSLVGARMRNWPGLSLEDAMPLRLAGGLHHLWLSGAEPALGPVYRGEVEDAGAIVAQVVARHDAALLPWFDGPPQTNEAGRSAGIMAGLLWLSGRLESRFEMNEIGCSAGANTMMERYAYDLGGVRVGPEDSPVLIRPEWRGPPPPTGKVEITHIEGCDRAPIDLSDPAAALRLRAYVWAENHERMARLDGVIALARERAPLLTQADAADWVEHRLAAPQEVGVCRVLYHSIVWQYLGDERRARITAAMEAAGARATPDRPLAWVMLETNRATFRHELRVRYWPGGEEPALLGAAHAHGAWVEWFSPCG